MPGSRPPLEAASRLLTPLVALAYCGACAAWILLALRAPWADTWSGSASPLVLALSSYTLPAIAVIVLAVLADQLSAGDAKLPRWILGLGVLSYLAVTAYAGDGWSLILETQRTKVLVLAALALVAPWVARQRAC